jgi:hypothetical protein
MCGRSFSESCPTMIFATIRRNVGVSKLNADIEAGVAHF